MSLTPLPEEPGLRRVAEQFATTRVAVALCDKHWNLVWIGDDLKQVLGEWDDSKLGLGRHILECFGSEVWSSAVTHDSAMSSGILGVPRLAHDTPGGMDRIFEILNNSIQLNPAAFGADRMQLEVALGSDAADPPEPIWITQIEWVQKELPPRTINQISIRLFDHTGDHIGFALVYASNLPANLLGLIARGDENMFARMAELYEPGRRAAAILFADIESSGTLSRQLSSASYFQLIRSITTKTDQAVVENGGIVGNHAGDGVTAFFLADQCGSPSGAVKGAMRAAREIHHASMQTATELDALFGTGCPMRIGVHWGSSLYMGQLVTDGRLGVSAFGDEVNQCARIEESASRGQTLASKVLLEQLDDSDAEALSLDPDSVRYVPLLQMPGVTEKAVRDAGGVPVASIAWSLP